MKPARILLIRKAGSCSQPSLYERRTKVSLEETFESRSRCLASFHCSWPSESSGPWMRSARLEHGRPRCRTALGCRQISFGQEIVDLFVREVDVSIVLHHCIEQSVPDPNHRNARHHSGSRPPAIPDRPPCSSGSVTSGIAADASGFRAPSPSAGEVTQLEDQPA